RHTRLQGDWSSDVCSSDLVELQSGIDLPPSNAEIAELLSREVNEASYILQRAYRRAARSALLWEVEARDLVAQKRSLTELAHIRSEERRVGEEGRGGWAPQ